MSRVTSLSALALGLGLVLSGCSEDAFCLDCEDAGMDAGTDSGFRDGAFPDRVIPDSAPPDGELPCLDVELCNERDDDCDGEVDEGIDLLSDPDNCGACDNGCIFPHAFAICSGGVCMRGECDVGFIDLDGEEDNGCEYRCLPTAEDDVLCDLRDNDCDGAVDEDVAFDTDPENCGRCGRFCGFPRAMASCEGGECVVSGCDEGFYDIDELIENGCEYSCTPSADMVEICNLRDDDCDGVVDDGVPGGDACGSDVGACEIGATMCVRGAVMCIGGVSPSTELCNMLDDDCDGEVDESNPEGGRTCGTSVGACTRGVQRCVGGVLECIGGVGPVDEICDGRDNDCDGTIDEGNPEGGGACGSDVGECAPGAFQCRGGRLDCVGLVGPTLETCNRLDDDCDGRTDEDFDLMRDADNCGACGNACRFPDALAVCVDGACELLGCETGFVDLDRDPDNGCEYACDVRGVDVCNGFDDDCDGDVDEELTPPATLCNPNGVCAGTLPTCMGEDGWQCIYGPAFVDVEVDCDTLDNDCDGTVDEAFPLVGSACHNGIGACRRNGMYVCNASSDGFECNADAAGAPADELCDNIDNDCDGDVDERGVDDPGTPFRDAITVDSIASVEVDRPGGGVMRIMQYEASRPDSSATDGGLVEDFACSNPDRVPWTNVTVDEARAACCALNADGTCPGGGEVGWRLCSASEWQSACEGPMDACTWSYQSSCATSQRTVCNGKEFDCLALPGDQDCVANTGSPDFPMCRTVWADGGVFDMSGNVREWVDTERAPGIYEIRGGSYQSIEIGRTCDFDFVVGRAEDAAPNTGFRCCHY